MRRYLSLPAPQRIGLLATIGFLLVLLVAPARGAEMEARVGADWIRVSDKPCVDPLVLVHIPLAEQASYRAARAGWQGKAYGACWQPRVIQGVPGVWMVYSDADNGWIPQKDMKPVPEV